MIVIVDGYNLIKQIYEAKRISHEQRSKFIKKLADYFQKRHLKGVIVFDGGESNYPYREKHGVMTVIFSGYKESADEVIATYIQEHREYELLIVSSDRAVRQYAETLGKKTMKATDFYYHYLMDEKQQKEISKDSQLFKTTEASVPELDELMMESTEKIKIKSEDIDDEKAPLRHKSPNKLSKKERSYKKVTDKLK